MATGTKNTTLPVMRSRPHADLIAAAVALVNARVPGRDLMVFLLVLAATDITGVLHVYGLSGLRLPETFFGLGLLFVLFAVALLAYRELETEPPRRVPRWERLRRWAWIAVGLAAGAWALQQLLVSVSLATAPPAGKAAQGIVSGQQMLLLVGLVTAGLLAYTIAYSPGESIRRRWIVLLSAGWFGYSATSLQFRLAGGPPGAGWYAQAGSLTTFSLFILAAVAVIGIARPFNPSAFLAIALAVGILLRLIAFADVPLVVGGQVADMLPLVNSASQRMLDGLSPYHLYQMPYDLPLTYWPLTFLLYVPFKAIDQDLRTANLLFGLVAGLLLWLIHRQAKGPRPGWAIYAFALLYLTPSMFQWDLVSAAPPFWLWLCLLFSAVVLDPSAEEQAGQIIPGAGRLRYTTWTDRLKEVLPGELMGAAFAASPLVLPFSPFVVIWWFKRGWRFAVRQIVAAAIVFGLVVIPFMLWDFQAFWYGAVTWFNDINKLPAMQWNLDKSWLYEIGLAGQLWNQPDPWNLQLVGGLKFLQLILLAGMARAAWSRIRRPADALRWGSATYILFMVLNSVIWPYLYIPALLGLIFTLAARERDLGQEAAMLSASAPTVPLIPQPMPGRRPTRNGPDTLPPNY